MVNLLSRTESPEPFPPLDPEQRARFESRLRTLALGFASADSLRRLEGSLGRFEGLLDELESAASLVTALDLLDSIERVRAALSPGTGGPSVREERWVGSSSPPPRGDLICYWPGRSLSTGEAGVASRGFFDVLDRPPIGFWIEAIARPTDARREKFEIAIIAWIPRGDVERAAAGRRACATGSLTMLDEASKVLAVQLRPILLGRSKE